MRGSALIGSPERCFAFAERLRAIGVDEIACLVNFGIDHPALLDGLARLNELRAPFLLSTSHELHPHTMIRRRPRDTPPMVSCNQARIWFLQSLAPRDFAYNNPVVVDVRGPCNVDALDRSVAEIVRRHDVLRTRFRHTAEGGIVPVTDDQLSERLRLVDPSSESDPERAFLAALDLARHEIRRPFDLAAEQPLRMRLYRLAPERHLLAIVTHLIACDGWSLGVLTRELAVLYTSALEGRAFSL